MGIGVSIFLLAVGAILAFAVDPGAASGLPVNLDTVGWILMVLGVVGLLWSLLALTAWRDRSRTTTVVDDRPVERERIVER